MLKPMRQIARSCARGEQGVGRLAAGAGLIALLAADAAMAADPWLHLSIAAPAAPGQGLPVLPDSHPWIVPALAPAALGWSGDLGDGEGMSFRTAESIACLVTGGTATAAALTFGWQNVTNLISGGIVPAAGPGAVALGLFGVVFTSFCAIGQALTPLYVELVHDVTPPPLPSPPGDRPREPAAGQTSSPFVIRAAVDPARGGCLTVATNGPRAGPC
jgi:hypothetical protein